MSPVLAFLLGTCCGMTGAALGAWWHGRHLAARLAADAARMEGLTNRAVEAAERGHRLALFAANEYRPLRDRVDALGRELETLRQELHHHRSGVAK